MNSINLIDFYKVSHRVQYPTGTEMVYSNWTPRKSRTSIDEVVFFGLQYFIKHYLIDDFNRNFFSQPKHEVINKYKRRLENALGQGCITYEHIEQLHNKQYLPIKIKALPEGTLCPIGVPMLTIYNTHPDFFWLTNYLETVLSCSIWLPCTSATTSHEFKKLLSRWANKTAPENIDFVNWQAHDFSMRGMSSVESACTSGAAHLLSFYGTDTVPAIDFLEEYYQANSDNEMIGGSVNATEHSCMCLGGKEGEFATFERLMMEVHPKGVLSIVSDTWNLWDVLTKFLPNLKEEVLNRDGKIVVRPDSGDPANIICGDPNGKTPEERRGVVQLLWDVFSGTESSTGYRLLNPKIGCIYGDGINLERAETICSRLASNGFASTNTVFGVGSYSFALKTRDEYGFAMKATYGEVNGEGRDIFKDPITDDGMKKSAKGLIKVYKDGGLKFKDGCTWEEEGEGELKTVFLDGTLIRDFPLSDIRNTLRGSNE